MSAVILVIHMILAAAIIGLVLLQRSEGGGLGIGGGGGMGGFASPQATANAMTKATWVCVAGFFTTSLILGIMAGHATSVKSGVMDKLDAAPAAQTAPVTPAEPAVPVTE